MLKKITKSMIEGINTLEKNGTSATIHAAYFVPREKKITLWEKIKSYLGVY